MKRTIIYGIVFTVFTTMFISCGNNSKKKDISNITDNEIVESYVYLLGRALVVRQEQMDFNNTGLEYNTIKYNEAGKADFVNPNLDVAYMESWIAIDENSAVILEIPEVNKRYYGAQLMDGWGEVLTNINERNYPKHPNGKFAIYLKGSKVKIPEDALKIELENKKIKMLARVELQDDLKEAVRLQKQFKMHVIGTPKIEKNVDFPMFTNKDLPLSEIFKYSDKFLETPDTKMPDSESLKNTSNKINLYLKAQESNANKVDSLIKSRAIPEFVNYAISKAGTYINGWLAPLEAGNYNGNYWTRSSANYVGLWANTAEEVVYYMGTKDSKMEPLKGEKTYTLKFTKENLPVNHANSFWSVIMVDFPNYRVVENELNRYNFNNFSELSYEKDGSLTLYISPEYNKKWPKSNWLPSPKQGSFNLTLRIYVPKETVLKGEWFPGGLVELEE